MRPSEYEIEAGVIHAGPRHRGQAGRRGGEDLFCWAIRTSEAPGHRNEAKAGSGDMTCRERGRRFFSLNFLERKRGGEKHGKNKV